MGNDSGGHEDEVVGNSWDQHLCVSPFLKLHTSKTSNLHQWPSQGVKLMEKKFNNLYRAPELNLSVSTELQDIGCIFFHL